MVSMSRAQIQKKTSYKAFAHFMAARCMFFFISSFYYQEILHFYYRVDRFTRIFLNSIKKIYPNNPISRNTTYVREIVGIIENFVS